MTPLSVIAPLAVSSVISGTLVAGTFLWEAITDADTTPAIAQDEPEVQEAELQEPEVQDVEAQEPELQEPEAQEAELQEPEIGSEVQDPELDDPDRDDSEVQDPETQDPEVQDPETDDPDPGGITCPPEFTPNTLVLNAPGGQVTLFVCLQ